MRVLIALALAAMGAAGGAAGPMGEPAGPATPAHEPDLPAPPSLVREVGALVEQEFYDPGRLEAIGWRAIVDRADADAAAATPDAAARVVRAMLARLGASHTAYETSSDRAYYDLLDIFAGSPDLHDDLCLLFPPDGRVTAPNIGLVTLSIAGEGDFAREVFPGSPADDAGIGAGDRVALHAGDGGMAGLLDDLGRGPIQLEVQRDRDGPTRLVTITPRTVNPSGEFVNVMSASARIVEREGLKLAYVRVYSWAGDAQQQNLRRLLTTAPLTGADGLVLDIRGGWGGASPTCLDLFNRAVPALTSITRAGGATVYHPVWAKPVALLVDEGTRSGKEIIAYAFKRHALGPVVGSRTAGAVLAGRPFLLSDRSLLYLAVADVRVDGERLEGVGVAPDVDVPRDLPYSAGRDPQLDAAYDALVAAVRSERAARGSP